MHKKENISLFMHGFYVCKIKLIIAKTL